MENAIDVGIGNGGNATSFDDSTEATILATNQAAQPSYRVGEGPIKVKVVDPRKVQGMDFQLLISGVQSGVFNDGLVDSQSFWTLRDPSGNVLYRENTSLRANNERILEQYGISIQVAQTGQPGMVQGSVGFVERAPKLNGGMVSRVRFIRTKMSWSCIIRL